MQLVKEHIQHEQTFFSGKINQWRIPFKCKKNPQKFSCEKYPWTLKLLWLQLHRCKYLLLLCQSFCETVVHNVLMKQNTSSEYWHPNPCDGKYLINVTTASYKKKSTSTEHISSVRKMWLIKIHSVLQNRVALHCWFLLCGSHKHAMA